MKTFEFSHLYKELPADYENEWVIIRNILDVEMYFQETRWSDDWIDLRISGRDAYSLKHHAVVSHRLYRGDMMSRYQEATTDLWTPGPLDSGLRNNKELFRCSSDLPCRIGCSKDLSFKSVTYLYRKPDAIIEISHTLKGGQFHKCGFFFKMAGSTTIR